MPNTAAQGDAIARRPSSANGRSRDGRDAARAIAPMRPAPDARVIDTTGLSLDEVLARIEPRGPFRPGQSEGPPA